MTNIDFHESTLASQMRTTSQGTVYTYIKKVLNDYQYEADFIGEPDNTLTPNRLMGQVIGAVRGYSDQSGHAAILNVNQSALSYWNRTPNPNSKHYLVAYGYSLRNGGSLSLHDVAPGAPYGRHVVTLQEGFNAVMANKGLVIR